MKTPTKLGSDSGKFKTAHSPPSVASTRTPSEVSCTGGLKGLVESCAHLVSSLDLLKDTLLNDTLAALAFSMGNFFAPFLLGGLL